MVRGINNCEFEQNVVAGQPNLENITYPDSVSKFGWGLPFPNESDVELIKESRNIKLDDFKINFDDYTEGGGTFIERVTSNEYNIKSMGPPSPFTMFWPYERPLFLLGKLKNKLEKNINSNIIKVDDQTVSYINKIIQQQNNPIIVIGGEQIQIIDKKLIKKPPQNFKDINENLQQNQIKIHRGIDNSSFQEHPIGSDILIFPFRNINERFLQFLPQINKLIPNNTEINELPIGEFKQYSPTIPPKWKKK